MRAPLVLCFLLALAGAATAVVPGAAEEEIVGAHGWFEYTGTNACSSWDPVLGIVSTSLTSRLGHVESGGTTTYTLHLDAVPGDLDCPAVDLQFVSPMAWPAPGVPAYGRFDGACGAVGDIYLPSGGQGYRPSLHFTSTPATCGLPFKAPTSLFLDIQPIASGSQACTPVGLMGCSGPRQGEYYTGCPQYSDQFAIEAAGFALVQGGHRCEWWSGEEYAYAGDGFGVVTIRGEQDSCAVHVSDAFLGLIAESADCPVELGRAIDDQDWSRVLP